MIIFQTIWQVTICVIQAWKSEVIQEFQEQNPKTFQREKYKCNSGTKGVFVSSVWIVSWHLRFSYDLKKPKTWNRCTKTSLLLQISL